MKKVSKLFLIPLMCITFGSLTACGKGDDKVKLTYGEVTHQKYHEISYARLTQMIEYKESFLLVCDPKGCSCFSYFMKASEDYIKDNHLVLYYMKVSDFDGKNDYGIKLVNGSTSFSIFNKGKIQQSISSNSSTEVMEKKEKFVEYIDQYVSKPNMYYVVPSDLEKMYKNANKSLIYFGRNRCEDCAYINSHFLYEYMEKREEILYVLDGDDCIRKYDEDGNLINEQEWKDFKKDYGLTVDNNPKYGFDAGVVPTFLLVSGTETETTYHSGAVAFNDFVEKVGDEYKVTNTYYSNARLNDLTYLNGLGSLEGTTVNKDDIFFFNEAETIGTWSKSASASSYFPRVERFLDTYLPIATYRF